MKILIVYASAGVGHCHAAEAIYYYLRKNYKEFDVKIIDVLDYTNFLFKNLYTKGYVFLVTRLAFFWHLAYQITYNKNLKIPNRFIRYLVNRINTKRFRKFLLCYRPHVIVATHFLPCEALCFLKRNYEFNPRLITIITDFNVHPFWITPEVDKYMVASDFAKEELISEGVEQEKIEITGIPIDLKFSKSYNKGLLCEKLRIKKDNFTVLIITAGFGLGPIGEIVNLLYQDVQLLVVCGKNNKLYRRLEVKYYDSVKIFRFIDNIEELMAVSDIIVTKPGGLTISESLAMGLPMIFISAIYGQETKNAIILENYGVGITPINLRAIRETVLKYKNNTDKLNYLKERINKIKRPYAAMEISECLLLR